MRPESRCEECGDLASHVFRSPDDLLHALQLAAAEVDRGVLGRVEPAEKLSAAEEEAMDSIHASRAVPDDVRYRFRCNVCGDRFELVADMVEGGGSWTREPANPEEKGETP